MNRRSVALRPDGRAKKRPGPEAQRTIIVDAAVDLFIEQGSAAVSVSELCARADVGRQTFYRCFDDKDALVEYLYQHAVNEHVERALTRLPEARRGGEWAGDVVDDVIDAILENHRLAQLLYIEASNPRSPAYEIVDDAMERAAAAIRRWYARQGARKPSKTCVKAVLAATTWLVHNAIISGKSNASVAEAKRSSRLLFEGLFLSLSGGR